MKKLIYFIILILIIACDKTSKMVSEKTKQDTILDCSSILFKANNEYKTLKSLFESEDENKRFSFLKRVLTNRQYNIYRYGTERKKDTLIKSSLSDIIDGLKKNDSVFYDFRYSRPPIFNMYYYSHSSYEPIGYPLKLFIVGLNRNPIYLKNRFDAYKKILYSSFDREAYIAIGANEIINELIESYSIYNEKFQSKLTYLKNYDSLELFFYDPDIYISKNRQPLADYRYRSWFNSFWYRRSLEGNKEVVYNILLEIQKHYDK